MMLGSGKSVMFRHPSWEASNENRRMGRHVYVARWRPSKGDLAHGSLLADVFLGWGN
jgi:hypothetical protein